VESDGIPSFKKFRENEMFSVRWLLRQNGIGRYGWRRLILDVEGSCEYMLDNWLTLIIARR
jgi:hypothetical protein